MGTKFSKGSKMTIMDMRNGTIIDAKLTTYASNCSRLYVSFIFMTPLISAYQLFLRRTTCVRSRTPPRSAEAAKSA